MNEWWMTLLRRTIEVRGSLRDIEPPSTRHHDPKSKRWCIASESLCLKFVQESGESNTGHFGIPLSDNWNTATIRVVNAFQSESSLLQRRRSTVPEFIPCRDNRDIPSQHHEFIGLHSPLMGFVFVAVNNRFPRPLYCIHKDEVFDRRDSKEFITDKLLQ